MQHRRRLALSLAVLLLFPVALAAQGNLRDLLTDFIRDGITLAPPTGSSSCPNPALPSCHVAHFSGDAIFSQATALRAFSIQVANQLSTFPLPSSSGGFSYAYDPKLGTFTRAAESFGPIYAERAETVGKGRVNVGLNYSHFSYDLINDLDLESDDVKLLFLHADPNPQAPDPPEFTDGRLAPWFQGDVISGPLGLTVESDIAVLVATYGISDRFDIGVAVPLVDVSLDANADLTVRRESTGDASDLHRFEDGSQTTRLLSSGSASGLGDILLRGKFRLTSGTRGGLALATDIRFPTGKEEDLLGTGVAQIKAFLVGSAHFGTFSPHVNVGYTWAINRCDGQSEGLPREECEAPGSGGGLPDEINYTGGFDWAWGPRVTFVADVIGRTFRNTQVVQVGTQTITVNTNASCATGLCNIQPGDLKEFTVDRLEAPRGDLNTLIGSAGVKINVFGNLLVTLNGLFSITKEGLQDKFTPVVGIDYAF